MHGRNTAHIKSMTKSMRSFAHTFIARAVRGRGPPGPPDPEALAHTFEFGSNSRSQYYGAHHEQLLNNYAILNIVAYLSNSMEEIKN